MWLWIFIGAILIFLFQSKFKEGLESNYQEYDEQTCLTLATQNENNIKALQTSLDAVLALQTQVTTIQNSVTANTSTLQTLTDQMTSTVT